MKRQTDRRRSWARLALGSVAFAVLLAGSAQRAGAREVEDMHGRKVVVPERIERVFATSLPATYLVYAIDPQLVAGLNSPQREGERRYTVPHMRSIPVIGGVSGMGRMINQEVLLAAKPDVIVVWDFNETVMLGEYEAVFRRMGIPWVYVQADTVWDYPEALAALGKMLGRQARGRELRKRAREMLAGVKAAVAAVPLSARPKVYYAEGPDGLSTEGRGSFHTELIEVAGGHNVHTGTPVRGRGMERISLEQVMGYDPEVILIKERTFYNSIYKDPRWANLSAVRDRRVFLIPNDPFNWFDRPPSFMRLLGAQWLLGALQPGRLSPDIRTQMKSFYGFFLGVSIDDRQTTEILGP